MIGAMRKMLKFFWLALLLGLTLGAASAKDLVVERALLEDASGALTWAQVKDQTFSTTAKVTYAGFSRSACWFRLRAEVPAG